MGTPATVTKRVAVSKQAKQAVAAIAKAMPTKVLGVAGLTECGAEAGPK